MSDEILDDMSLSDDDLLDTLADDMLMEMSATPTVQLAPVSTSPVSPSSWPLDITPTPNAVALPATMPDLGQMMSQMMPMMSQMFGANAGASSMFNGGGGGGSGAASLQQVPVSWQELVKRHVPSHEQEDWLKTIDKDVIKLRGQLSTSGIRKKTCSRSYCTKAALIPNASMQVSTMLVDMLHEAVRSAQLEDNQKWQELKKDMASYLMKTGMTKVFESKLKEMLRQRVSNDLDFVAEKTSGRYGNIVDALAV
uniref:Uncharacterized protein n=1 Tax=Peronospora matthiolae TaxID=2874970 RepID=A0AAV1TT32_9STRA